MNLKAGTLAVRRTLQNISGRFSFGEPKSASSRRRISLPPMAVRALREHRKRMLAEGHTGSLVFCSETGSPIRRDHLLQRSFASLLKKADLPRVTFHSLRHAHATMLFGEDVHPKVVQARLGHSTIGITMDLYSHAIPSLDREAAQKLGRVL